MLCYFKKSKDTTEIQKKKKICAEYGEGAVPDTMWFAKFRAGDFSLDDVPWSGRSVE